MTKAIKAAAVKMKDVKPECEHKPKIRCNGIHEWVECTKCDFRWYAENKENSIVGIELHQVESPKEPEKEEWREQCQFIVDYTYGKNSIDATFRDYYTKKEIDKKLDVYFAVHFSIVAIAISIFCLALSPL